MGKKKKTTRSLTDAEVAVLDHSLVGVAADDDPPEGFVDGGAFEMDQANAKELRKVKDKRNERRNKKRKNRKVKRKRKR